MKVYYSKSCDEYNGDDCFLVCMIDSEAIFINTPDDSFKLTERNNSSDYDEENLHKEIYLDEYASSRGFEPVVKIRRLDNDSSDYELVWINETVKSSYIKSRLNQLRLCLSKKLRHSVNYDKSINTFICKLTILISKI